MRGSRGNEIGPIERPRGMSDATGRIPHQIRFVLEIDRLKGVLRQTLLTDASRRENSAEHSWHLATMAVVLAEHADATIDLLRAVKMALIHDIVEIDAGDAFCYDPAAVQGKEAREHAAATRIFGLLPEEYAAELRGLWEEFEAGATPEARFVNALDRLQPLLHNLHTEGGTWRLHSVTHDRVLARMDPIRTGAPALWPYVLESLEAACAAGHLSRGGDPPV